MTSATNDNPLLQKWHTPHQTPPFASIRPEHFAPAIREAIAASQRRVDAIVGNKAEPTFDNTIVALERADEPLGRITGVLFNLNECHTGEALQQVVMEVLPDLTRYENAVSMNERLFARVRVVYDQRERLPLAAEQLMLLDRCYKSFVRHGVGLSEAGKRRFAAIEERLSQLSQQFNRNVLADTNDYALHLTDAAALSGLPEGVVQAAAEEARSRHLEGWVFTLDYPSYGPFITYADRRDLREQMWRAYNSRGNRSNANDNNDIIGEIVALRHEKAALLGFDTYCDYVLGERMVGSLANLTSFMERLSQAAMPAAKADYGEVAASARAEGADFELQRWDFSYYAERLKRRKYDFDAERLRPYFQLERVRQGIFDLYGRLYGLRFAEAADVEVYHPDVRVYQVLDGRRFMGLLYLDMHPRPSKRGGAWMTEFRGQRRSGAGDVRPLIQVVCNFSKPVGDKPALLSFGEVETFMHEFGHAMHGMLSDVSYESLSGTNVLRDFVELPSQLMENWCYEPDFLNTFARHYETDEPLPAEFIDKIRASERHLAGWLFVRQLNLGQTDIAYHSLEHPMSGKAEDFERGVMTEFLPPVAGANTSTSFTHIFSGGYASGYYGYKWAEVLDADVFSRFKADGIFNRDTATAFRREVLSRGGTVHPATLFRNFMGRDPDPDALMRRCGFVE